MRRGRHGLTLTELLVAMSILLVGIYAVARGFPALFGNLESERVRTEMARQVETRMEAFKTAQFQIPDAITGHDPLDGSVIPPEVFPDESAEPIPGNPRDDLTWILGETFEIPIAQAGQTYSVYTLNMGPAGILDPALVGDYLQVSRVIPLRRTDVGLPLGDDQFYLDEDGFLYAPPPYATAKVDYIWVDTNGEQHGVMGEIVDNANVVAAPNPVRATLVAGPPAFSNVLPELASAEALEAYTPAIGQPIDVAPGVAVLESNFGATLLLPAEDAGETMEVNYQLKTEDDSFGSPRRVPIMVGETTAPTEPPYRVDLAFRGIDDEHPLFTEDLLGAAFAEPAYVLIVDRDTGATWTDAEAWVTLDFIEGRLTLDWTDASAPMTPAEARGRDLRLYYRTIAGHTIVVQKAPSWFVEDAIYQTYVAEGLTDKVDYRYFQRGPDPDDATYTQLLFPMSAADQMVTVDYTAGTTPPYERVSGELHAIPGDTLAITLDEPNVHGILAVRGVSLTVQGWWHNQAGNVQLVGIDTFLMPEPLL